MQSKTVSQVICLQKTAGPVPKGLLRASVVPSLGEKQEDEGDQWLQGTLLVLHVPVYFESDEDWIHPTDPYTRASSRALSCSAVSQPPTWLHVCDSYRCIAKGLF